MDEGVRQRSALLLIATESEWAGRSLESVLTVQGYAVLRTQSGRDALELVRRTRPDAVILDERMPDFGGIDVCKTLRDDPLVGEATPIILIGSPTSQVERAAAYAAGAWSFYSHPLDAEVLVGQLATFIRAHRAASAAREQSLVDPSTGLLSPVGLERWAEQLVARAARNREPLAAIVLMAPTGASAFDSDEVAAIASEFIESSRGHMRRSDIVGRTPDGRLALLAPDTDDAGVLGMVQRLRSAIEKAESAAAFGGRRSADFRVGYCAIDDFSRGSMEPVELLRRAERAHDYANSATSGELAFNFNHLPIN